MGELNRLQIRLEWEMPKAGAAGNASDAGVIQGFLDGFCMVYADVKMLQLIDLHARKPAGEEVDQSPVANSRRSDHRCSTQMEGLEQCRREGRAKTEPVRSFDDEC